MVAAPLVRGRGRDRYGGVRLRPSPAGIRGRGAARPFCSCVQELFPDGLQTHNFSSAVPFPSLASEGLRNLIALLINTWERVKSYKESEIISGRQLPADALPVPAKLGRVPEQAQGVQQHTPRPGSSEGIHGAFRDRRRKQDQEVGKTDRGATERILWRVAVFIFALFSGAVFIRLSFYLLLRGKRWNLTKKVKLNGGRIDGG